MKKIFLLVLGLMSLVVLSSCEDSFSYYDENEFIPLAYTAKISATDDSDALVTADTLEILGVRGLVFDYIEKTDWKIITPSKAIFRGNKSLSIDESLTPINVKRITEIKTNYDESIPITFGNTDVRYTYRGQLLELEPLDGFNLSVKIEVTHRSEEPFFVEYGNIVYILMADLIPVKVHRQEYFILDKDVQDDELDNLDNDNNNDNSGFNVEEWEDGGTYNVTL